MNHLIQNLKEYLPRQTYRVTLYPYHDTYRNWREKPWGCNVPETPIREFIVNQLSEVSEWMFQAFQADDIGTGGYGFDDDPIWFDQPEDLLKFLQEKISKHQKVEIRFTIYSLERDSCDLIRIKIENQSIAHYQPKNRFKEHPIPAGVRQAILENKRDHPPTKQFKTSEPTEPSQD